MADIVADPNTYSVWLSTAPYDPDNGNTFINLCSNGKVTYGVNYGGNATGILGKDTTGTLFVDTTGGAVGTVSVSGTRANPRTLAPQVSGVTDLLLSNADFETQIEIMLARIQMYGRAYILRIYRVDWVPSSVRVVPLYRDIPVFFYDFTSEIDIKLPNNMDVTYSFYKRNLEKGFGT